MHDPSDTQLLRAYAERGTEAAFAEIVARHTDLVYSAALRQVYSPDLARDVTQSVFTDLARKAREVSVKLSPEASLVGWLYRGTRFAARDIHRGETRRVQRERQAMEQLQSASESPPDWEQLRPALDDAMSELEDADRDAVLLRYFKNHDLRTVGAALGISDDAAQKRVSRAVERLRELFAKRGVTVGASGLAVVISANAVQAAPVGLALTISTAAVVTGTTLATTATVSATKAIAMTALQKTIITATIAGLAGTGIYEARQASQLRQQVQMLQQEQEPLAGQAALIQALTEATNQVAGLRNENEQLNRNSAELLKLRGEVGLLRSQAAEFARLKQEVHQPEKTEHRQPPDEKPDAVAVNDFPKESWVFAGYATPDATLQTWAWAMSRGDERTMLNCLTTDGSEAMAGFLTGKKSDQPIVAGIINSMGNIPGYKITDNRVVSASEILVAMLIAPSNPSDANKGMTMRLRKVGNEWKIAGPVKEE